METLTAESARHHCRICLRNLEAKELGTTTPGRWYHLQETPELKDWLQELTPLQTVDAEYYPQYVCSKCYEQVQKLHELHDLVLNTAMVLDALYGNGGGSMIQEGIQIKEEQDEDYYETTELKRDDMFEYINTAAGMEEEEDNYDDSSERNPEYMIKFETEDNTEYITPTTFHPSDNEDEADQPKAVKQFKCAECGRKYAHKYTYIAHIRQDHLGIERAFECEQCHKTFTKFCNLYRHMRLEHDEQLRQFKCEYDGCKRSFRQLQTRRKHYEDFHKRPSKRANEIDPNLVMLQAERKAAATTRQQKLQQQKNTTATATAANDNNEARRFICPLCPATHFTTLYSLQRHMQTHSAEMKYVCPLCGKHKISQAKLDEHIATAHDSTNYPCPVCGKTFKSKSHVSVHVCSVHKGLRPFACSYCPASFAARNTLKLHVRTHTGEKPFACDICGRRFTQLSPMKKHKLTHEKGRRNAMVKMEAKEATV